MQPERLGGAIEQMPAIGVKRREAAQVDVPQVDRRIAADDPFGHQPPGAAGVGDAGGVEARADEIAPELGRLAQNEIAVQREALRSVQQHFYLRGFQAGRPMYRIAHQDLELIPILAQQLELEPVRNRRHVPRLGYRLEATHHQAADLFLVIDESVGIAHHRQVAVDARDRTGDDVEMLGREQRYIDAGELAEFTRPLSCAIDQALAADLAFAVLPAIPHAGDISAFDDDAAHRRAFDDPCAAHAGPFRQRLRQVGRVRLAVAGNPHGPAQVVGPKQRIDLSGFAGRDELEVDAEASGARHLALQKLQSLRRFCDVETAALLPTGGEPGFVFERRIELDTVAAHPRRVARRAKLADQARSVPGRAAGQLALL